MSGVNRTPWLIPAVVAVALLGVGAYYWLEHERSRGSAERPAAVAQPLSADIQETAAEPASAAPSAEPPAPTAFELPALEDSDGRLRADLALTSSSGTPIALALRDGAIARIVATVDNLPREFLAERIRPIDPVAGHLQVSGDDIDGSFRLLTANSARYDALVAAVRDVDAASLAALYRNYYPLLQQAYRELGNPDAEFHDRLLEVIEHLLYTPTVGGEIRLQRPNVLYVYTDPKLEALSSGQKILLRMGEANASVVLQQLRAFRAELLRTPGDEQPPLAN